MGSGKTSYIIQTLKDSIASRDVRQFQELPEEKYFIVVPYLKQIDRIKEAVQSYWNQKELQKTSRKIW